MRSVSSTLTAAAKGLTQVPSTKATATRKRGVARRPDWQVLWSGTGTSAKHGAAWVFDDGVVEARVRVVAGVNTLEYRRVRPPGTPASWATAWSAFTGVPDVTVPPAVVASEQENDVWVFYVDTGSRALNYYRSTDGGATWGSVATLVTVAAGHKVTCIGGCCRPTGDSDLLVVWSDRTTAAGTEDISFSWWDRSADTWAAAATWAWASVWVSMGITVAHDSIYNDWNVMLAAIVSPGVASILTWYIGDDGVHTAWTWEHLDTAFSSDAASSDFAWYWPSMVWSDCMRFVVSEYQTYTTGVTWESYVTAHNLWTDYHEAGWEEPEPYGFVPSTDQGAVLCGKSGSGCLLLISHSKVWYSDMSTDTHAHVDNSIISYVYECLPWKDRMRLFLDNHDGSWNGFGAYPLVGLKRGSALELQHGLMVAGVSYRDTLPEVYIESIVQHRGDSSQTLELVCEGWERHFSTLELARAKTWVAGGPAVDMILRAITALRGITATASAAASAQIDVLAPGFAIQVGQSVLAAIRRLMAKVPDVLFYQGNGVLSYKELVSSEAAAVSIGGTGQHPILFATFSSELYDVNLVALYGATDQYGMAIDYEGVNDGGLRRQTAVDTALLASASAAIAADGALDVERTTDQYGVLAMFPLYGVELWDVVSVTYASAFAGARSYRVVGIREELDRRRGRYLMKLVVSRVV